MPTYILFKTQSMILLAKSRNHQPDANLHPVKAQSMLLSTTTRERLDPSKLTDYLFSLRVSSCEHLKMHPKKILTYILFITKAYLC